MSNPLDKKTKTLRLSRQTQDLLVEMARQLTDRDGVRKVTQTEVLERAVSDYAKKVGVQVSSA